MRTVPNYRLYLFQDLVVSVVIKIIGVSNPKSAIGDGNCVCHGGLNCDFYSFQRVEYNYAHLSIKDVVVESLVECGPGNILFGIFAMGISKVSRVADQAVIPDVSEVVLGALGIGDMQAALPH